MGRCVKVCQAAEASSVQGSTMATVPHIKTESDSELKEVNIASCKLTHDERAQQSLAKSRQHQRPLRIRCHYCDSEHDYGREHCPALANAVGPAID